MKDIIKNEKGTIVEKGFSDGCSNGSTTKGG